MLHIYNTETRKLEQFEPLSAGLVRMYVCGMTVYDHCHIGHGRVLVVFDTVVRCLRMLGYEVHYTRNITDVDDKILARAAENGEDYLTVSERYIKSMHEDCARLQVLPPEHEPRATQHIEAIIAMIERLLETDYAYTTPDGDVYYEVRRFSDYGKLSNQKLDKLISGARVESSEHKKHPADFALWKSATADEVGWDAPWSRGRPGWHIECSAMSKTSLGDTLDIHGGGPDLIFPHHENEIAQSEAANGCALARLWMHVGAVRAAGGEDMSKSKKNFVSLNEAFGKYHPDVLRYYLMSAHYRSALDYEDAALSQCAAALERLYRPLRDCMQGEPPAPDKQAKYTQQFMARIEDDFNIPEALAVLFELSHELNSAEDDARAAELRTELRSLLGVLGLAGQGSEDFFRYQVASQPSLSDAEVERLIEQRKQARERKDYASSDEIRARLEAEGVYLEDAEGKTIWHRKAK